MELVDFTLNVVRAIVLVLLFDILRCLRKIIKNEKIEWMHNDEVSEGQEIVCETTETNEELTEQSIVGVNHATFYQQTDGILEDYKVQDAAKLLNEIDELKNIAHRELEGEESNREPIAVDGSFFEENDLPAEQCQTESDASTCPTPTSSNCGLKKVVKLKIDHDGGRYFLTQETYTVVDSVEYPDLELHLNEKEFENVDIYVERMRNWTLNEHRQPSDSLIPFNCGRRVIQN